MERWRRPNLSIFAMTNGVLNVPDWGCDIPYDTYTYNMQDDSNRGPTMSSGNWARLGERIKHCRTGKYGIYVEHVNIGEGYMMKRDDGEGIIVGHYSDFDPVDSRDLP